MKAYYRPACMIALFTLISMVWNRTALAADSPAIYETYLPAIQRQESPLAGYRALLLSNRDGDMHLYTLHTDGSHLQRLADLSVKSAVWSPDGTRVLFTHAAEAGDDLYLVDSDGTDLRPLAMLPGDEYDAAWSPDGRWVLFLHDQNDLGGIDLYYTAADAPQPQRLTSNPTLLNAVWAPEGMVVAYTADEFPDEPERLRFQIFVLDVATGQAQQATAGDTGFVLHGWVNGGKRLLASEDFSDERRKLVTLLPDGTGLEPVNASSGAQRVAAITPDGLRLAYTVTRAGTESAELYMQELDQSAPLLASDPFCSNAICGLESARFAPDGDTLAYVTWHAGSAGNCPSHLWIARDADGTAQWHQLGANVYSPVWVNNETIIVHHGASLFGTYARTPYVVDLRTGLEMPLLPPGADYNAVLEVRDVP